MGFEMKRLQGEDLLVTNARVFAKADSLEWASAMAVRDGRVVAVGDDADLRRAGQGLRELDLGGRTVLPGFIDAHTHVEFSAMARYGWLDIRNLAKREVLDRIERAVGQVESGDEWVIAQATFLQPLPSREEVDGISAGVPVVVRESMHRYQANTEAMRRAGLLESVGFVPPGGIVHVDEHGVPTGLVEEAFHLFPIPEHSVEQLERLLARELSQAFASSGVTTVYEIPATRAGVQAYRNLAERGDLPTRISLNPVLAPGLNPIVESTGDWDAALLGADLESDLIAPGGVKIFIDGDNQLALDSGRLFRDPREWGAVTRTLGQLTNELVWATRTGVQAWVHAIGDLAQDLVLEAVARARAIAGAPRLPMRLEHVANLQLEPAFVERLRDLDVIPVPTANFLTTDDGTGLYAYRTLIDAGMRPPGNSDTGGAIAQAPNPWFGIALLMERRNAAGVEVAPAERISALEGVRTYTEFSAHAAGLGHLLGRLDVGYAADFAVYQVDPRALDPQEMRSVQADMTFVGGRRTWERIV